jgi:hypothetical protein
MLHRLLIDRAEALGVILAWRTPVRGLTPQGSPWKRARPRAECVDAIERVVEGMHSSLVFWADARAVVGRMARIWGAGSRSRNQRRGPHRASPVASGPWR